MPTALRRGARLRVDGTQELGRGNDALVLKSSIGIKHAGLTARRSPLAR